MEERMKQIIRLKDDLVKCTICSFGFLMKLVESKYISEEVAEELGELKSDRTNQSCRFYDTVISGNRDHEKLLSVLQETGQWEAVNILNAAQFVDVNCISDVDATFEEKLSLNDPCRNDVVDNYEPNSSPKIEMSEETLDILNIDNLSQYGAYLLGKGMYDNFVYKLEFNGVDTAVKSISTRLLDIKQAILDLEEIRKLGNHQNVVQIFFGKELNYSRFIVRMELCDITMHDWINKTVPLISPMEILRQCTIGLVFLHENKITHGNLKPSNVLLFTDHAQNIQIKVSDFRPRLKLDFNRSTISIFDCDTFGWMAPEILSALDVQTEKAEITMTPASDVFSLGCMYYFLMTKGKHPFGGRFTRSCNILDCKYVISLSHVTEVLPSNACIVVNMTHKDPTLRPSTKSLLRHHIFWSSKTALQFIEQVVECCKETSASVSSYIQRLEEISTYVLPYPSKNLDWINKLDPPLQIYIRDFYHEQIHTINTNLIVDLLNIINYICNHPRHDAFEVGDSPDEVMSYLTLNRFPFLIPIMWKTFECMNGDHRLAPFYESYYPSQYEVIEAVDLLRCIATVEKTSDLFEVTNKSDQTIKENERQHCLNTPTDDMNYPTKASQVSEEASFKLDLSNPNSCLGNSVETPPINQIHGEILERNSERLQLPQKRKFGIVKHGHASKMFKSVPSKYEVHGKVVRDSLQEMHEKKDYSTFHSQQIEAVLKVQRFLFDDKGNGESGRRQDGEPVLIVAPTGSGKSGMIVLLPYVIESRKVLILTPSIIISKQLETAFGINRKVHSFFQTSGYCEDDDEETLENLLETGMILTNAKQITDRLPNLVIVNAQKFGGQSSMSLQTKKNGVVKDLVKDVALFFARFDTLIVDEAHHYPAETWKTIVNQFKKPASGMVKQIIFLTATPFQNIKGHEQPILPNQEKRNAYEVKIDRIVGKTIREAQFVEKPSYSILNLVADIKNLLTVNRKLEPRFEHQVIIFVRTVTQAVETAKQLCEATEDSKFAIPIVRNCKPEELKMRMEAFKEKQEYTVAVNCVMLDEGYDNSSVSIYVILRNVGSQNLFQQCIGRAMRMKTFPKGPVDRSKAYILSYTKFNQQKMWLDRNPKAIAETDPEDDEGISMEELET